MSRPFPTPQALVETITRLLPQKHPPLPGANTRERILDAALELFSSHGIRATTMSQIASRAGISREWLYKQFRNRDAVVVEVTNREVLKFIDGLAVRAFAFESLTEALTDLFIYSVEFLRDHALLQRVLDSEIDGLNPGLLRDSSSLIGTAVSAGAGYLSAFGDLSPEDASVVAESLVRIVASITIAPLGTSNLQEPAQLRRYAGSLVPALMSGFTLPPIRSMADGNHGNTTSKPG